MGDNMFLEIDQIADKGSQLLNLKFRYGVNKHLMCFQAIDVFTVLDTLTFFWY